MNELLKLINNPDDNIRKRTISKIIDSEYKNKSRMLINHLKIEQDINTTTIIIHHLGKFINYDYKDIDYSEIIDIFQQYSQHENDDIRWVTIEALGKSKDIKASQILIEILDTECVNIIRRAIIKSLANFNLIKVIKSLLYYLQREKDELVIEEIYLSLEKLGITSDFQKTVHLCQDLINNNKIRNDIPKVLIDTSILIDYIIGGIASNNSSTEQSINFEKATKIIQLVLSGNIQAYITEIGLRDIWDISDKLKSKHEVISWIISLFYVCQINEQSIKNYSFNSFETNIQIESAKKYALDMIITQRFKDFLGCEWKNVFSPCQFIDSYTMQPSEGNTLETFKQQLELSIKNVTEEDEIEKLQLFDGWKIEYYELLCSNREITSAKVKLSKTQNNKEKNYHAIAHGKGGSSTLFDALDKAISHIVNSPKHTVNSIKISNTERIKSGSVLAAVVVKTEKNEIQKIDFHTNIIKACFFAYIKAIREIYSSKDSLHKTEINDEVSIPKIEMNNSDILALVENMGEKNFSNVNLRETNLSNVNLEHINLIGSNLSFSNLAKTNLYQSSLIQANLTSANLAEANLTEANLTSANLTNADLTNANLTNADLTNTILNDTTAINILKTSKFVNVKMPEFRIMVDGEERIKIINNYFNQINSENYKIFAIHNNSSCGYFWKSEVGREYQNINKQLIQKGILIKRIFILNRNEFNDEIKGIIEQQIEFGVEVKCISTNKENFLGLPLSESNLLVCENEIEANNSFTTMRRCIKKKQKQENGYISYEHHQIALNKSRFNMIWNKGESYQQFKKFLKNGNNFNSSCNKITR